jgi:hypothetical protein
MRGAKGGVWYLSDIVMAIVTIFSVLFMLLISAFNVFTLNTNVQVTVLGGVLHEEPRADNSLLVYLDTTRDGRSMAEWLALGVSAGSMTYTYRGKEVDLAALSGALMEQLQESRAYKLTLEMDGKVNVLASRGKATSPNSAESWVIAGDKEAKLALEVSRR